MVFVDLCWGHVGEEEIFGAVGNAVNWESEETCSDLDSDDPLPIKHCV